MKTYWDHTEHERAELSESQVADLLKYELMEAGIITPEPPGEAPEKPEVQVARKTVYGVELDDGAYGGSPTVWFENQADAETVANMTAIRVDYDYQVGREYEYAHTPVTKKITSKSVFAANEVEQFKGAIMAYKSAKESHDKKVTEYREASEAVSETTQKVWDDWYEQLVVKRRHEQIYNTYLTYLGDCDDNNEIAAKFLIKAFDEQLCREAFARISMAWPLPVESEELESVTG